MKISIDPSTLRESHWSEYVLRFLFGGIVTVLAGVIATEWGPAVGGLFLAFPAIAPATVTLIEKHQKERKERLGLHGRRRARQVAGIDAAGTAIGSLGLLLFAAIVWRGLPAHSSPIIIICASLAWMGASVVLWYVRKRL